jgi:hypothetical protein
MCWTLSHLIALCICFVRVITIQSCMSMKSLIVLCILPMVRIWVWDKPKNKLPGCFWSSSILSEFLICSPHLIIFACLLEHQNNTQCEGYFFLCKVSWILGCTFIAISPELGMLSFCNALTGPGYMLLFVSPIHSQGYSLNFSPISCISSWSLRDSIHYTSN